MYKDTKDIEFKKGYIMILMALQFLEEQSVGVRLTTLKKCLSPPTVLKPY